MLSVIEKNRIIQKDSEIGRLEMLLELQETLKEKGIKDHELLIITAINLGFLYDMHYNIDIEYGTITGLILKKFKLLEIYNRIDI